MLLKRYRLPLLVAIALAPGACDTYPSPPALNTTDERAADEALADFSPCKTSFRNYCASRNVTVNGTGYWISPRWGHVLRATGTLQDPGHVRVGFRYICWTKSGETQVALDILPP